MSSDGKDKKDADSPNNAEGVEEEKEEIVPLEETDFEVSTTSTEQQEDPIANNTKDDPPDSVEELKDTDDDKTSTIHKTQQAPPTLDEIEQELKVDPFNNSDNDGLVEQQQAAPDPQGSVMGTKKIKDPTTTEKKNQDSGGSGAGAAVIPPSNTTTTSVTEENNGNETSMSSTGKKFIWISCSCIMVLLLIIIILQFVIFYNLRNDDDDDNNNNNNNVSPSQVPTNQPSQVFLPTNQPPQVFLPTNQPSEESTTTNLLVFLANISPDDGEALSDRNSPQYAAYKWLVSSTTSNTGGMPDNIFLLYTEERWIQRYALATLYYSTAGEDWKVQYKFLDDDGDECNWSSLFGGVYCYEEQTIWGLFLGNNNLYGSLPREIGLLTDLETISLGYNDLYGTIPTEISALTNLVTVELQSNGVSGRIPDELGFLPKLSTLQLYDNNLTGEMPRSICRKTQDVTWGDLSVDCYEVICDCCTLCCWELASGGYDCEYLTFTLPPQFRTVSPTDLPFPSPISLTPSPSSTVPNESLFIFLLRISPESATALRDKSSAQFAAYSWLESSVEDVVDNIFEIYSTTQVVQRFSLATIYYSTNGDNWTPRNTFLDPALHECEWRTPVGGIYCDDKITLSSLSLGYNNLVGTIPPEIALLSGLRDLSFYYNQLSGTIPSEISALTKLAGLDFRLNNLSGTIPESLGILTKLTSLSVSGNKFTGDMPYSICTLIEKGKLFTLGADCDDMICQCCTFCCYGTTNQDCEQNV